MPYGNATRAQDIMEDIVPVGAAETITAAIITSTWLPVVDREIDDELRQHYEVPLRALNGAYATELIELASMWCAGVIIQARYAQAEPNLSARGEALVNLAKQRLNEYKADLNTRRLRGQRRRSHNHFADPTMQPARSAPQQQPTAPVPGVI
ncbi:MAG: hypothetical protein AAB864_01710 [Patescibacteria group bacterium]